MKPKNSITVVGARQHNLKNISLSIPKDTLTVITGPSGSGKSTLALDILYAEGQRRYIESLSSYARQFLGVPQRPDVDKIEGLCPAVAIDQKTVGHNPRSTVGTITEIYDYLRVLFARVGSLFCYQCDLPINSATSTEIVGLIRASYADKYVTIVAPVVQDKKGEFVHDFERWYDQGYYRFIVDGRQVQFSSRSDAKALDLKKSYKHTIDVVLDMVQADDPEESRLHEAIERSFALAGGMCKLIVGESQQLYSSDRICIPCGVSCSEIEPRLFSFNSPLGACSKCQGLGTAPVTLYQLMEAGEEGRYLRDQPCDGCKGSRLNKIALAVRINDKNIAQLSALSVKEGLRWMRALKLPDERMAVAQPLVNEIIGRYTFLANVGLEYLSIARSARTLSGGEGQRIRLATQIGSALSGVLYVLDEPSIGLHQRDNDRLIATLHALRDQGNTVVVVEHDHDTMRQADYLIDMGPAAGVLGGQVMAAGTPQEFITNPTSLTGAYLSGQRKLERTSALRVPTQFLTLHNVTLNNLQRVDAAFPLGVLCGVSGVSGSGKSSLVMQAFVPAVRRCLAPAKAGGYGHADSDEITGVAHIEDLVVIDQNPIGRSSRSTPATYLGIFDDIRALFAQLPESNARGYSVGRFSFNVAEGRCSSCLGNGTITVSMHFLPDVTMVCSACKGTRYNQQTREILYKGKHIADVLAMTVREAASFFEHHKKLARRLQLLCDVGLDYLQLGQESTTLSGGEAQRIKLVNELAKRGKRTLYVLDEPTTGLHAVDVERLLQVFERLVEQGNSVVIIEHNIDLLKSVDYILDLGPEGGDAGGTIVAQGTPQQVAQVAASHTGRYLKEAFASDKGLTKKK